MNIYLVKRNCKSDHLLYSSKKKKKKEVLTGAPGFPGTDIGGMLGLPPGGATGDSGVGTGLGVGTVAVVVIVVGAFSGAGDFFKRFNASLGK